MLALVVAGLSNDEIGERLVSADDAQDARQPAMTKLVTRDRTQPVVLAYESGLDRRGWVE